MNEPESTLRTLHRVYCEGSGTSVGMNTEPEATLQTLHRIYCEITGHQPPFSLCERRWFEWQKHFAEDDLQLTLEYVMRLNKKRERQYHVPTRFGSIIGDLERFSDLCGEARADKRARDFKAKHSYPEAKASVLRSSGRSDTPTVPENVLTAKEALERLKASL